MSADGSVKLAWGDGEHTFCLKIGQLRELEEKRDAGGFQIFRRLAHGDGRVDDIYEILRLGLIGGGMATHLALGYVAKYVRPPRILDHTPVAVAVLNAALFGDPLDPVGKVAAEISAPDPSSSDGQGSRPTSAPAPQWDGLSTTSTEQAFGNSPRPSTAGNGAMDPNRTGQE